jgi:hypothetical protein
MGILRMAEKKIMIEMEKEEMDLKMSEKDKEIEQLKK